MSLTRPHALEDADGTGPAAVEQQPARRRGRFRLRWPRLGPIVVAVVVMALWVVLAWLLDDFYVASPRAAADALADGVSSGWIGTHLRATATAVGYGYGVAVLLGLTLGFLIGLSRYAYAVLEPLVMGLYALPKIVLFPVFLFIFGFGIEAQAGLGASFGVFPILVMTMAGTRNIEAVSLKVARSLNLSRFQTFRAVVFPSILPQIVTGLRLGFGVTFLGVIMAEMFASRRGVGYLLVQSVELHDMPTMYGIVVLLVLAAGLITSLFVRWERSFGRR